MSSVQAVHLARRHCPDTKQAQSGQTQHMPAPEPRRGVLGRAACVLPLSVELGAVWRRLLRLLRRRLVRRQSAAEAVASSCCAAGAGAAPRAIAPWWRRHGQCGWRGGRNELAAWRRVLSCSCVVDLQQRQCCVSCDMKIRRTHMRACSHLYASPPFILFQHDHMMNKTTLRIPCSRPR